MEIDFIPTNTITDIIYEFTRLYERVHMLPKDQRWLKKLTEIELNKSALASVTLDISKYRATDFVDNTLQIQEILDTDQSSEFLSYRKSLEKIWELKDKYSDYNIDLVETLHAQALGEDKKQKYNYRKEGKVIDRVVHENNVYRTIKQQVGAKPSEIRGKLEEFVNWLNGEGQKLNPLIMAALSHVIIATIHPYSDGNGRLARSMDNFLMAKAGFDYYALISLEEHFLLTIERYHELVEKTIETQSYTEWVEYYLQGLLSSAHKCVDTLKNLSGGAIDLKERKIIKLTDKEEEALDLIASGELTNGAAIGKKLGVTRQSINNVLHRLRDKELIEKHGNAASTQFKPING